MTLLRTLLLLLAAVLAGCATPPASHQSAADTAVKRQYTAAETSRSTIDLTRPPNDVWERIRRGFAIPNLQSELTDYWTDYYASKPEAVHRMSQRAGKFLYHIIEELERRGLPSELALLPFVESAYNPVALSRVQASGLWQFMPATGRQYNLSQDWWRDQRRDPIASTQAALEYLSYLYEFQGDWYLALASYNWGEGSVRRAIDRNLQAGLPTDYQSLRMPDETRNYVPKLQAIKNIVAHPEKYGITLPHVANIPYFVAVKKTRTLDIAVAAQLAGMPEDDFKTLNPSHNRPVILGEHQPVLLLPVDRAELFQANLLAYQGRLSTWDIYKAKAGESYAAIAKRHGITLGQLRQVNGLGTRTSRSRTQVTLLVPARAGQGGIQLASLDTSAAMPAAAAAASAARQAAPAAGGATRRGGDVTVLRRQANVRTHTIRQGDTLFALAKRYGTTVQELKQLNNLKDNKLSLGKRLRVPGTSIRG